MVFDRLKQQAKARLNSAIDSRKQAVASALHDAVGKVTGQPVPTQTPPQSGPAVVMVTHSEKMSKPELRNRLNKRSVHTWTLRRDAAGHVSLFLDDATLPCHPYAQEIKDLGIERGKVQGTDRYTAEIAAADLRPGTKLRLIQDTGNAYNTHALWIAAKGTTTKLGYIRDEIANVVSPRITNGTKFDCFVIEGTGPGVPTDVIRVLIAPVGLKVKTEL